MEDLRNTVIREHRQLRNAIRQERMTKFFFFFFCYSGTTVISLAMSIRDVVITVGVLDVVVVLSNAIGRSCG